MGHRDDIELQVRALIDAVDCRVYGAESEYFHDLPMGEQPYQFRRDLEAAREYIDLGDRLYGSRKDWLLGSQDARNLRDSLLARVNVPDMPDVSENQP